LGGRSRWFGAVDASVHPYFEANGDLLRYMKSPWVNRGIPDVEKNYYAAPNGDFAQGLGASGAYPASDPAVVGQWLFETQGVDAAVLLPLTRGTNPDRRLGSAICAGVNDWLAQVWLADGNAHGRYRGTIRVNPADPEGAVREIERWADHPHMVQVGVPVESREPYGKPQFWPIWEAVAHHKLPVVTHIDGGAGVDFPPTPAGSPLTFSAFATLAPLNVFYHLMNLTAEGVFERFEHLIFVFGDGGADLLTPLMWRYDMFWRAFRDVVPWSPKSGSSYLKDHVRFITAGLEGPQDPAVAGAWYQQHDKASLMLFGSHYPSWSMEASRTAIPGLDEDQQRKVYGANAAALYGIERGGLA
jgi:predicted TIM-barrel fold metal-dependent hydrolase